jgi:hypothetical protein
LISAPGAWRATIGARSGGVTRLELPEHVFFRRDHAADAPDLISTRGMDGIPSADDRARLATGPVEDDLGPIVAGVIEALPKAARPRASRTPTR